MKTKILSVVLLVLCTALVAYAQVPQNTQFGIESGYRTFVMNSQILANNGAAVSIGGRQHYFALGPNLQVPLSQNWAFNLEADVLFGGEDDQNQRTSIHHCKQKISAVRADTRFGFWTGIGVSYYFTPHFYAGLEGGVAGVFVNSRLEESGKTDVKRHELELVPLVGPKVGLAFGKNRKWSLEGALHAGKHGVGGATMLAYHF